MSGSSPELDELALLAAWQRGDERAGKQLVERHYSSVARFFINKDRGNAADLIQRTFLRLLEARDRMRGDSNVRAFLLGIARNVLYEHFRRSRRDGERIDFGARSVADLAPTPTSLIARERQSTLLLRALRLLPLELQLILELYYWEELSAREVADILELKEGTARTRIRRARILLEREIAKMSETPEIINSTISDLDSWARRLREGLPRA